MSGSGVAQSTLTLTPTAVEGATTNLTWSFSGDSYVDVAVSPIGETPLGIDAGDRPDPDAVGHGCRHGRPRREHAADDLRGRPDRALLPAGQFVAGT